MCPSLRAIKEIGVCQVLFLVCFIVKKIHQGKCPPISESGAKFILIRSGLLSADREYSEGNDLLHYQLYNHTD